MSKSLIKIKFSYRQMLLKLFKIPRNPTTTKLTSGATVIILKYEDKSVIEVFIETEYKYLCKIPTKKLCLKLKPLQ